METEFRTICSIEKSKKGLTYTDQILSLGSCFAEHIGKKLENAFFQVDINPFGVLYNPVSILNSISFLIERKQFTEADIFEYRSLWHSFSHSSLFSDRSPEIFLNKINSRLNKATELLQKTGFLLITFGTAWVYEEKKSGSVVSNCHTLPSSFFTRRRLSVEEIVQDYSVMISKLHALFPTLNFIFSVSPIRHWKDGAHENNLSKSILHLAIDQLQQQFSNVLYFPAYEIQLDELRDYRFYTSDMFHPSDVAVEYIWQRFSETYFDAATLKIMNEIMRLSSDLTHRPLHPDSEAFLKFQAQLEQKIVSLKNKYPFLIDRI